MFCVFVYVGFSWD